MRFLHLFIVIVTGVLFLNCLPAGQEPVAPPEKKIVYSMKGVGIDLPQSDFEDMKKAGIEILSTEWGMEEDVETVRKFLDQANAAGLKVVMDGGIQLHRLGFYRWRLGTIARRQEAGLAEGTRAELGKGAEGPSCRICLGHLQRVRRESAQRRSCGELGLAAEQDHHRTDQAGQGRCARGRQYTADSCQDV